MRYHNIDHTTYTLFRGAVSRQGKLKLITEQLWKIFKNTDPKTPQEWQIKKLVSAMQNIVSKVTT